MELFKYIKPYIMKFLETALVLLSLVFLFFLLGKIFSFFALLFKITLIIFLGCLAMCFSIIISTTMVMLIVKVMDKFNK